MSGAADGLDRDALARMGGEEAAATAAFLARALPPALRPIFDASFVRSHILYGEFVARLVARILREAGVGEALAAPGTAAEIAGRAGLDGPPAAVALDWMLRFLASRGSLEETAGDGIARYRLPAPLAVPDAGPVQEEQLRHDARWRPAYALAETVAGDYPAFLRGRVSGEDVLFSPRRLRLWVDYFSNDNGLYAVNNRVGAVAAEGALPPAGGAILELGGGLGSGALALLERLEGAGRLGAVTGYHFTEPVPAFLRRGEQALRTGYPSLAGIACGELDMNRPFAEQGVAPASVALVYAVNTLHVARDLEVTLGEVRRALAPGGRVVLSECVRPRRPIYAEFVFNLAQTFRAPRLHPGYRPHGGFLRPEHWRAALIAAGFADVHFVPDVERVQDVVPDFGVAAAVADRP